MGYFNMPRYETIAQPLDSNGNPQPAIKRQFTAAQEAAADAAEAAYAASQGNVVVQAKAEMAQLDMVMPRVIEDLVSKTNSLPPAGSAAATVMQRKEQLRAIIRGTANGKSMTQKALDAILNTLTAEVDATGAAFTALGTMTAHGIAAGQATAPANNPTNAKTDNGLLVGILGADMNASNARQNQMAQNLNTLAGMYNDLASKFNLLLTRVAEERQMLNDIKAAGSKL